MNELVLDRVTLIVLTSVRIDENIEAMKRSMNGIKWGAVKFISHEKPQGLPDGVVFEECNRLNSIDDFSRYTFLELHKHIETEFMILVHHDGWIARPSLWTDDFFKFDYIGAPWPWHETAYKAPNGEHVVVGNGGMRLTSKRFLELPTKLGLDLEGELADDGKMYYGDDGNYCCIHRKIFLENGIEYATAEKAALFSTEIWIDGLSRESFGFHGFRPHNMKYLN